MSWHPYSFPGPKRLARQRGFTLVELIVVILIVGVIAAMAAVRLSRARVAGNEASAIGSLRAINGAQSTYASSCGAAGDAQSLDDLAKPPSGSSRAFISPDLGFNGVLKSGYVVTVEADADATVDTPVARVCNAPAEPAVSSYFAAARPASSSTGHRSFATDRRSAMFVRDDGTAIAPGMSGAVPLQ